MATIRLGPTPRHNRASLTHHFQLLKPIDTSGAALDIIFDRLERAEFIQFQLRWGGGLAIDFQHPPTMSVGVAP